ncbi:MAG: hypothetical protein U0531_14160 [Dehalococcoidia bacterium]
MVTYRGWRRLMYLQGGVALAFAVAAVVAFVAAGVSYGHLRGQLRAQRLTFPPSNDPMYARIELSDLQRFAGRPVDSGEKAHAYASGVLRPRIAAGVRRAQEGGAASWRPAPEADAKALDEDRFVEARLLAAWGWWSVCDMVRSAGFVLLSGALAFLAAVLLEVSLFLPAPAGGRKRVRV